MICHGPHTGQDIHLVQKLPLTRTTLCLSFLGPIGRGRTRTENPECQLGLSLPLFYSFSLLEIVHLVGSLCITHIAEYKEIDSVPER